MRNQIDLLATVTVLGVLEQERCQLLPNRLLCVTADLAAFTGGMLCCVLPAYFALQVIYARRRYKISPPETTGHPEFDRIFRAQYRMSLVAEKALSHQRRTAMTLAGTLFATLVNCSEYFPLFISLLWVAGIFFHQGVAAACGLLYLYTRFKYFQGYAVTAQERLGPLYASARLLWLLLGLAVAGLLAHFLLPHSSPWTAALVQPLHLLGIW